MVSCDKDITKKGNCFLMAMARACGDREELIVVMPSHGMRISHASKFANVCQEPVISASLCGCVCVCVRALGYESHPAPGEDFCQPFSLARKLVGKLADRAGRGGRGYPPKKMAILTRARPFIRSKIPHLSHNRVAEYKHTD